MAGFLGDTSEAFGDDLSAFLSGQQRGVTSSNVAAAQYNAGEHYLQLGYKNGGWYGYHDVSPQEAASFYSSGSKGNWVWDNLRVRGTVFGYRKPYAFIGARSQGYEPKYYASDVHREQHRRIGPGGELPLSWTLGKGTGGGPYDADFANEHAPHPHGQQHPMTGLSPHPAAEKFPMGQAPGDVTHRKVPMAYHAPQGETWSSWLGKGLGKAWGWLTGQHKAGGGEVEQRLGDGGDDEPIFATPGEYVETRAERARIDRLLGRDSSKPGGAGGHFARGGRVMDLTAALGAHKVGGILAEALGGSAGSLGGSMAAGGMVGGMEGAMAAGGGPIGLAIAGAQIVKEQLDKLRDGLYGANDKLIGTAEGFAKIVGVPESIAKLGGSVLNLISPLNASAMAVGALTDPVGSLKKGWTGLIDVGASLTRVFWDLRDPAAMIQQVLGPFIGQVGKYNPATVERFQLALDNLSAAAGYIFEPLIEGGRELADEFNVIVTAVGPELREALSGFIGPMKGFGRETVTGLVSGLQSISEGAGPVVTKLLELGPILGQVLGGLGNLAGLIIGGVAPAFGNLIDNTKILVATFMAAGETIRQVMERIASPLNGPQVTPLDNFNRALERLQGAFSSPAVGAMTFAAQQARHVGIEDVGLEARRNAFSQGVDVAAQQLAAQQQGNGLLQQILNALQAAAGNVGNVGLPPGQMGGG